MIWGGGSFEIPNIPGSYYNMSSANHLLYNIEYNTKRFETIHLKNISQIMFIITVILILMFLINDVDDISNNKVKIVENNQEI